MRREAAVALLSGLPRIRLWVERNRYDAGLRRMDPMWSKMSNRSVVEERERERASLSIGRPISKSGPNHLRDNSRNESRFASQRVFPSGTFYVRFVFSRMPMWYATFRFSAIGRLTASAGRLTGRARS